MKTRPLGFLTSSALVAALISLLVIGAGYILQGGSIFSPGELLAKTGQTRGGVSSHAQLANNCTACHTAPWDKVSMAQRCLACHQEVADQLKKTGTLHAVLLANTSAPVCLPCHTEHKGENASITFVDQKTFPHDTTGYSLLAHQLNQGKAFTCQDCHPQGTHVFNVSTCAACHAQVDAAFMQKHTAAYGSACLSCHDGRDSYGLAFDHSKVAFALTGKHNGLDCTLCHTGEQTIAAMKQTHTDCFSCHKKDDIHNARFGTDCSACHVTSGWARAAFDHGITNFPLTGAHTTVACLSCHQNNQFKGTPMDCFACHQKNDAHEGGLGTQCAQCHVTAGWSQVSFNHADTAFPLIGAHTTLKCQACHQNGVLKGTPTQCVDCHQKDDPHQGGLGQDCGSCHVSTSWKEVTFDHGQTAFPLTGAHQALSCQSCHHNGVLKGTPTNCYDCHQKDDHHQGAFGQDCALCHGTTAWNQITFNHATTAFPLSGAHGSLDCLKCHANAVFKGTPTQCSACHPEPDIHKGLFGSNCSACHSTSAWLPASFDHSTTGFALTGAHAGLSCSTCHSNGTLKGLSSQCSDCHAEPAVHKGQFGTGCATCHSTSAWLPATFDHSKVGFTLSGAHVSVACASCHPNNVFKGTPTACASCHPEPAVHKGQFGTDCASCHSTTAWLPATFDHSKTAFALTGAHLKVACASCHVNNVFKGTPTACSACHPEPAVHKGLFGTDCAACHSTTAWLPAGFNGPHPFPMNHGGANSNCQTCHPNGFNSYTCYSCHANIKTDARHQAFANLDNCVACHPTGGGGN